MECINNNTYDLDIFLDENCIKYNKTYQKPNGHKEDKYIRYYLHQTFNIDRNYMIDIFYNDLVIFEYESEKYAYISTILFEENNNWENINKKLLFGLILKHMSSYVESDNENN